MNEATFTIMTSRGTTALPGAAGTHFRIFAPPGVSRYHVLLPEILVLGNEVFGGAIRLQVGLVR
ncbi:hypothetical protein OAU50_04375, partial [Planctomycetota bacterium]|nr:hypothetical protein [Planctomycetota bacterium]